MGGVVPDLEDVAAFGGVEPQAEPAAGIALDEDVAAPATPEVAGGEAPAVETQPPAAQPETVAPEAVAESPAEPAAPVEETPREQYLRGQRRARAAASKRGIELRKRMAAERMGNEEFDPTREVLYPEEREPFIEGKGKLKGDAKREDIAWHHSRQTSQNPDMADVPEHIQPVTKQEHFYEEHGGDTGNVPTTGTRGDVTTPENPIYDADAPDVQARRYDFTASSGEQSPEQQGMSELPGRKPPDLGGLPRVPRAFRGQYDVQYSTRSGVFRHHIATGRWVFFPR
jgi:hypothetical protein